MRFSPPIDCSDVPHELALVDLQTTNSVINVRDGCNRLIYKANGIGYSVTVPEGTYNVSGINEFLYIFLSQQFRSSLKAESTFST